MIAALSLAWLVEALIASAILMVVVLLLRAPVRRMFGADVAYALWLLPVLRLVLPPLPLAWHDAAVAPVLRATERITVLLSAPAPELVGATVAVPSYPWIAPALALAWVAGAGAFVAWHALAHHRFCRRLLDHSASSAAHGDIRVIETSAASGPLAFGVWRRYIAFPQDFAERFDAEERDLALAHELGHHARGDLIANWVALVVLALHWFNPIAWRAFRLFRADQEIANDARVLAGMNPMRRHTYACAILKAAHPTFLGGTVSATCHLHTIDDLKGRLKMLTTTRTSRTKLVSGSAAIGLLTLGGLGLTASGSQAAEQVRSGVRQATGVDIAALVPPTPPARAADIAPAASPHRRVAQSASAAPPAPELADATEQALPAARPEPPHAAVPVGPGAGGTTMITVDKDGRRIVRHGRYVKLNRDGTATMIGEDRPLAPPMPPVRPAVPVVSRQCGPVAEGGRMVLNERSDSGRRIVICTDRVAIAAARGAEMAANSHDMERTAYARALEGLRVSRARMTTSYGMTSAERSAALAGIDTAITELEQDLAKAR